MLLLLKLPATLLHVPYSIAIGHFFTVLMDADYRQERTEGGAKKRQRSKGNGIRHDDAREIILPVSIIN
jgi:hypothetical protein